MRTLVHLSDLHFGRVDAALLEPLRRRVQALYPRVTVISGDLTQRAKPHEFQAAKRVHAEARSDEHQKRRDRRAGRRIVDHQRVEPDAFSGQQREPER